jgi:hypothetical protein
VAEAKDNWLSFSRLGDFAGASHKPNVNRNEQLRSFKLLLRKEAGSRDQL